VRRGGLAPGVAAAPARERAVGGAGRRGGGHSATGDNGRSRHCRRRGCCCTHSSVRYPWPWASASPASLCTSSSCRPCSSTPSFIFVARTERSRASWTSSRTKQKLGIQRMAVAPGMVPNHLLDTTVAKKQPGPLLSRARSVCHMPLRAVSFPIQSSRRFLSRPAQPI
jgi:hypothetical protein